MDDFFRPNQLTFPFYIGEGISTALVNGRDSDDLVSGGACNGMRNTPLTDLCVDMALYNRLYSE